ncbi:alpha/beta hydrolase [Marinobacter sp. chi1]|uniref:Alpha/beta hydrolase n=1 Tax=Marinobacter suaedae TaxID=3057675 RepID=A0ABT8W2P4_9GAMM|nr:alpha/beta family hydrolase [Marinobacter sp. chi1]MDO3722519.1 alpha/beta hydrolase [Marinobacter sp. chi1]
MVVWIKKQGFENHPRAFLVLAHGAGAPADSPFMETLADALEAQGVATVRFEFPYMEKRREDGKKRPPDRQPKLLQCFSEVVESVRKDMPGNALLLVGGKSMGGRMASILATQRGGIDGVIGFGYPFHPPGKPDRWRTDHFDKIDCPFLLIQGTRDPFGKRDEVEEPGRSIERADLHWLEGGNHDFQPLAKQQSSQRTLIEEAAVASGRFVENILAG